VGLFGFLFVGWLCPCMLPVYLEVPYAFLIKPFLLIKEKTNVLILVFIYFTYLLVSCQKKIFSKKEHPSYS
jgi:hypothetical protein